MLLVIAMFALASFVNVHQGYAQENKDFEKRFEWWPTDANPGPVKDEVRLGRWWWPQQPGQVTPWGNRGYIYVKGGDGTKPSEGKLEEAKKAKELERAKKVRELEEAARIKKAQELEEAQLAQKKDKKTEIHDTIVSDKDNVLLVTDFSSGTKKVFGSFAGEFGTWENDPKDETQFCRMEIGETLDRFNKPDYFVRLNYDVGSPRPAFNGFWMKLNHLDITPYEYVSFLVKGESIFTTQLKIELKNKKGEKVVYFISGITPDWQRVVVPLDKLKKVNSITDWTDMTEFVVVFDDIVATEKAGTICIDDLNFAKFGWEKAERSVR